MATTGDNVDEEDWFSNSSIEKLMVKTKNYEQQEAKSQSPQVISSKKSGQPDTYLCRCHKLLRAPNCGINNSSNNNHSNNNNNNNNNDNREASTTTQKQKRELKLKQNQVQSKMRLLVIGKNVEATQEGQEEVTCMSKEEASRSTSSNLTPESHSEVGACELSQKDHNESDTSMHRDRSRFQVLAKKCQLMYGKSNMILSDAKVNCNLFRRENGGKRQGDDDRDHDRDRDEFYNQFYTTNNLNEQEKESRQRKRRSRRKRRRTRSIKLVSARYNSGLIKMWPSWRQLVLLSFLSIVLTSLLANLNIISPMSTSSCLLFNHCHALSMKQQASPSNLLEAAPGTKITHPSLSSPTSTIVSTSTGTPTESPPFNLSSSTTPVNSQKNINTFFPTLKPRYSQLTPTTPNSSGASINAPTVSPVSTTQSSNVAVAFVPASSQRLSHTQPSQLSSSSLPSSDDDKDKDKKHSTSTPTSLWSSKLRPTEQQLHKQQLQQRYQQHAKQQQLTQLTGVANSNKTTTAEFQQAHVQEFTTPASSEGGNNRQKFTFDNNYQNANENSKSSDMNNNGNFRAGAKISIKNNGERNSGANVVSSITRESHVEPQMSSSGAKSNLLGVSNSDELPAIVVGRRAQQQKKLPSLTISKVPSSSSSSAIKLIASPTLHVSESSTTPSSTQLNPSSPPPFPSLTSQANIQQAAKPTLSKSFQLGDGWSITSDTSDSSTTPNSLVNDTSIRYNPGIPPADLHKAADSTGRASVLASSGGSSVVTSPPVTPRQAEATHHNQQQILVPAGGLSMPQNLFQSMIQSALSDLVNNEQLFGVASTSSRPIFMRSRLHPVLYQPNLDQPLEPNNRRFQLSNNNYNNQPSKQTMAASASAPSISLPPLSHFLVPRNPFRLFSSSSSTNPITTRYRPSFIVNKSTGKANSKQANGNEQRTNRWSNVGPHHTSASNSFPRTPAAFQGSSTLVGLDDNTNTNLYAHPHSVEQLERLIRAASQATGVNTPILPAIVSAPSGTFPGYYIPAIESESESQVNELTHGEPSSSISSKIPGTDYILHPDEVRAMINIGEIAWRQQQQNEQGSHQAASSKSNLINFNQQQGQDSSISEPRDWQFGNRNPNQAFTGYMQENHAENTRDFAYVDPSNRRDQMQAHSSNNNDDHQQHRHQHQTRQAPMNSSELESHLMKHFHQKQLNSFPAIIRVNDQDYIHWPLIKIGQDEQSKASRNTNHPSHSSDESRKFTAIMHPFQVNTSPFQRPNQFFTLASPQLNNQYDPPGLLRMPLALNGLQHLFPHQRLPNPVQENHNGWTPSASMVNPSVVSNQKSPATIHIDSLDQSPVRLATQLTPQEVRQVEDSIIEALIMNQSLQHQRKIMEGLIANQNQLRPTFMIPNPPSNENIQKQNSGFKNGLFGRRRRRNSNNNSSSKNNNYNNNNINNQRDISHEKIKQLLLAAAASSPQIIGPIPLVNVSALPVHFISPMLPYTDLPEHAIVGPAPFKTEESLVLESRLAPKHRLPILIADQETNRPTLLKPVGGHETLSADSSSPKATILKPPSGRQLSDNLFAESGRASIHSEAAFGSRVSRVKHNPSVTVTSGTSTPLDEPPFIEPERTKLNMPSAHINSKLPSPPHPSLVTSGRKLVRENEPYSDRIGSKQLLSLSQDQSTSRPYRHVDWPTMVSDADYFPDSNGKDPNNPANSNVVNPQQAESKNLNRRDRQKGFSNNQADNNNLHLSSSHVIKPSQSDRKYITSQLKLQFAQDYQAREGVPIYNNNVRIVGALDRQRSMLEGRSSHITPNTVSSQRVPIEIDSSNEEADDEADDESSERDLQQKSSSETKISTPVQAASNQESTKSSSTATKLKLNTSRYERRPNSRGPQVGQSQLFD